MTRTPPNTPTRAPILPTPPETPASPIPGGAGNLWTDTTLSQIGLAMHFGRATSAIRSQGEYVTGMTREGRRETWARAEYSTGRLAGYRFVSATPPRGVAMIAATEGRKP